LGVIFDRKHQYYVRKTSISTNHPFSCNHRFGTKKSPNNVILEVILPVIWDICLIENIIFTYVKQAFPQIVPFPFDHRFGTKKSPQKVISGVMSGVILGYFSIENINIT